MSQLSSSNQPVFVHGGEGRYPVIVGTSLSCQTNLLVPWIEGKQVMVVTTDNLIHYAQPIVDTLKKVPSLNLVETFFIKDGDEHKSLAAVDDLWQALISQGYLRDCTLIAIGGGVVGDLVGFAAACYMRGVDWINFPTTLLAQVDAAIGGKTAINHTLGKNIIGAFHAPKAVFSDIEYLDTLPDNEFLSGLAEVVKYGIALDQKFFQWLDDNISLILKKEPDILLHMVKKCSSIKAQVVNNDFKEKGQRALLNFGHTVGHAIETNMHYQMRHGFAVSIGMVAALKCSLNHGLKVEELEKAVNLLEKLGLPTSIPNHLQAKELLVTMGRDKKNLSDAPMRMILLSSLGKAMSVTNITPKEVIDTLLYLGAR